MQLSTSSRQLRAIEAIRGVAASLVIFSHVARHLERDRSTSWLLHVFGPGHAGVDLFFVLSGFIILHVHRADIGRPAQLRRYAGRRITRVLPLYWLALAGTVILRAAGQHDLFSADEVVWAILPLPTAGEPVLAIAWTLQYEAVFYVCFGLAILDRRIGAAAFVAWMLAILAFIGAAWPPALFRVFGFEFLFGLVAAEIVHRHAVTKPGWVALGGAATFAAAYWLESCGMMSGWGPAARLAYGLPSAALIAGLALVEQRGAVRVPHWLQSLGRSSYSIYLFQFLIIGTVWQGMRVLGLTRLLPSPALFVVLAGTALVGGTVIGRLLERPLLKLLRRRRPESPSAAIVTP